MKKIIAMLVIGTLLIVLFNGCERKEPSEPSPPPEQTPPSVPTVPPQPTPLPQSAESNPEAEKAAVAAADAWLKLVDVGQYAESWAEAAEYFKNAVSKEDWQKSMEPFRKPLGALVSRTLKSTDYTTTAPGAPDGQYVIIQYDSSFENKKSAVETVTPMLDKDGKWRVSGYFIK
ncbi:MAG: DUF4019 domain-containing protein [Sedimentisphaerales bacterium]|nr:DUF4019 domain-containing protein [Sedimentisphaerales bacterium]